MVISGKKLSQKILNQIKKEIIELQKKNIVPKIVIITVGSETTWNTYVRQKLKLAEKLGIQSKHIVIKSANEKQLIGTIEQLNNNNNIYGIIVQRPLPAHLNTQKIIDTIDPKKDIDGFRSDSKFEPPIWLAVEAILKWIFQRCHLDKGVTLTQWLKDKQIVVIGKGETGGRPVILSLKKLGIEPQVIDRSTKQRGKILKRADIIISAVGKPDIISASSIKKHATLIGIGIHRGKDGKLHGDYDEETIEDIVSYYTPTPGGVGPLNLAYLFKNLIKSAKIVS